MNSLRYVNLEITTNLNNLTEALQKKESVVMDRNGTWHCESTFGKIFRKLLALDNNRVMKMVRVFNACLDEKENQTSLLTDPNHIEQNKAYITAGSEILKSISQCNNEEGRFLTNELSRRIHALAYRSGISPTTEIPPVATIDKITAVAKAWKSQQFYSKFNAQLDANDLAQIHLLAKYKDLSELIFSEATAKDKDASKGTFIQNKCFEWMLRDGGNADIFAEYPGKVIELCHSKFNSNLAKRAGYFRGNSPLRIGIENGIKTLQLHVKIRSEEESKLDRESKEIASKSTTAWASINDPNTSITFKSGQSRTAKEIIEIFANKDTSWGPLEVLGDGQNRGVVDEWHCANLDKIDLTQVKWWNQIPKLKWLSVAQLQEKYPHLDLNGGKNWVPVAMATRLSETFEAKGTHAYNKFYIPEVNERNEVGYQIRVFGFYPREQYFPKTLLEMAKFPFKTFPGQYVSPDPSISEHERQQGGYAEAKTPEQAFKIMGRMKKKIVRGREGKIVYCMLGKFNCARSVTEVLEGHIPSDLYQTDFEASRPIFPCNYIFRWINKLPKSIKNWVFKKIFSIMGGNIARIRVYLNRNNEIRTRNESILKDTNNPAHERNKGKFFLPAAAPVFHTPGNDI